jgi:hypothetical protein
VSAETTNRETVRRHYALLYHSNTLRAEAAEIDAAASEIEWWVDAETRAARATMYRECAAGHRAHAAHYAAEVERLAASPAPAVSGPSTSAGAQQQ